MKSSDAAARGNVVSDGLGPTRTGRLVNTSSLTALVFLLWDICLTLDNEVEYIWPLLRLQFSSIKWLFLFLRYVPLAALLSDRFIGLSITVGSPATARICKQWFMWQGLVAQVVMLVMEVLLMIRVHALYNRSYRITVLLVCLLVITFLAYAAGLVLLFHHVQFGTAMCLARVASSAIIYFGAAALLSHFTVLVLTLVKYAEYLRTGLGRTPLLTLLVRDGSIAFTIMFAILIANTTVYMVLNNMLSSLVYCWSLAIASSAGCRLILNMCRLAPSHPTTVYTMFSTVPQPESHDMTTFSSSIRTSTI